MRSIFAPAFIVEPVTLHESSKRVFEGTKFIGDGFLLNEDSALDLIDQAPSNHDIVQPFIDSDSVTDWPDQRPSRWIINFGDRSLEEAATYQAPFQIVLNNVKPIRDEDNREQYRRLLWQFAERRRALTKKLTELPAVFVAVATTKFLSFSRYATEERVFGNGGACSSDRP